MSVESLPPSPPAPPASPPAVGAAVGPPASSSFASLLSGLGREVHRGESLVRSALHAGRDTLDPGNLLALQAGVYRYGQAVDLASRLIDRATTAVKTVLQGQ